MAKEIIEVDVTSSWIEEILHYKSDGTLPTKLPPDDFGVRKHGIVR